MKLSILVLFLGTTLARHHHHHHHDNDSYGQDHEERWEIDRPNKDQEYERDTNDQDGNPIHDEGYEEEQNRWESRHHQEHTKKSKPAHMTQSRSRARDDEVVDNGGHRVVYGRNKEAGHNTRRQGQGGRLDGGYQGSTGNDYDAIMKNRPVDKKEIKSALEKKLDMFDGIDDKYAEWAKKIKAEQPEVKDGKNLAKNEHIDEKLQERIDRFYFLRNQVMQYSNEIEEAVAALHSERIVSETGRWEQMKDNYQNQTPLNANLPRVRLDAPQNAQAPNILNTQQNSQNARPLQTPLPTREGEPNPLFFRNQQQHQVEAPVSVKSVPQQAPVAKAQQANSLDTKQEDQELKQAQENLKTVEQQEYEKLMNSVDMAPKYDLNDSPTADLLARGVSKAFALPKRYAQRQPRQSDLWKSLNMNQSGEIKNIDNEIQHAFPDHREPGSMRLPQKQRKMRKSIPGYKQ